MTVRNAMSCEATPLTAPGMPLPACATPSNAVVPRRGISTAVAITLVAALVVFVALGRSRPRPSRLRGEEDLVGFATYSYDYTYGDVEDTWRWMQDITNETSFWRTLVCPTAAFALCDIAMCTLNDDGLTASCGCQKMSASTHNPANVGLGAAAVLGFSSSYRSLLETCVDSLDDGYCDVQSEADSFCDELAGGTLYPSDMGVDYVSFYSVNPVTAERYGEEGQQLADDLGTLWCEDAITAVCEGAPCYETAYDAPVFDLTCICPVTETSTSLYVRFGSRFAARCAVTTPPSQPQNIESHGDGHACDEINADERKSCAASSTTDALTLFPDANALADTIAAIEVASAAGDSSRCPSMGTKFPYFSGEHSEEDDSPYAHS